MSTEILIPSPFQYAVTVRPHPRQPDRWEAGVMFDGVDVTLGCNHLHHSEAAARKCVAKVERREAEWLAARTVQIDSPGIDYSIFEQEITEHCPPYLAFGDRPMPARDRRVLRRYTRIVVRAGA